MKKTTFFKHTAFTALVLAAFTLSSCDFLNFASSGTKTAAPDITVDSTGIIIAPTTITGAQYMTIIRYEVSDKTASATKIDNTTILVGQITPEDSSVNRAYQFTDSYVAYGHYYQYYIRYKISSGYTFSATSKTVYPELPTLYQKAVVTNASTKYMSLETTGYTLTLDDALSSSANINVEETNTSGNKDGTPKAASEYLQTGDSTIGKHDISLMVAINNGSITRLFPMSFVEGSSSNLYSMNLRSVLPESFFGVDLSIQGITIQDTEYKYPDQSYDTIVYTNYHWMQFCTDYGVKEDGTVVDTFMVKTSTSDTGIYDTTDTISANRVPVLNLKCADTVDVGIDYSPAF